MLVSISELALNYGCNPKIVWHLGGHEAEELDEAQQANEFEETRDL